MKLPTASSGVSSGIAPSCLVIASGDDGSQPAFALTSFGAVHLAIHPCGPAKPDGICDKPQGILAKANKYRVDAWNYVKKPRPLVGILH
jgi:hypothetical protein